MAELRVLFEDNHCLVLEKPSGVLMVGDQTGDISLFDLAKDYIRAKYNKPGEVFLGVVHRLDRPVSGVALFARTSKGAARLSEQFRVGTTEKVYAAWVLGRPPLSSGTLTDWLHKDESCNVVSVVRPGVPGAQMATLDYRVLAAAGNRTLVEVRPKTGRPHQIRVQLANMGCPIIGDIKYGGPMGYHKRAIALHAKSLAFEHPTQKTPVKISSPLPAIWEEWFDLPSFG